MKFIMFADRTNADKTNKSGKRQKKIVPFFVEKSGKYGGIITKKSIPITKRIVIITGPHDCGKTRYLTKMANLAEGIWRNQVEEFQDTPFTVSSRKRRPKVFPGPVLISAQGPINQWLDNPHIEEWWDGLSPSMDKVPWSKLQQYKKINALPSYLKEKGAVLFVDDAHLLTGRKLQVVKSCVTIAGRSVITCEQETMIPTSLRIVIMATEPEIIRLRSDASYDHTDVLMWVLIVIVLTAGFWEMALILGGMKMLGKGRTASKV